MKKLSPFFMIIKILIITPSHSLAYGFMPTNTQPIFFKQDNLNLKLTNSNQTYSEQDILNLQRIGEQLIRIEKKLITSDLADHVEVDSLSNEIRLLEGNIKNSPDRITNSRELYLVAIEEFINSHPEIFGIKFESLKLNSSTSVFNTQNQFFKFDVYVQGKLIKEAQIDFRFRSGELYQIVNNSFAEAKVKEAIIDENEAVIYAAQASNSDVELFQRTEYRVDVNAENQYILVPTIVVDAPSKLNGLQLEIDLSNATIRQVRNKHYHATTMIQGFARTYKDSPLKVIYERGVVFSQSGTRSLTGKGGFLPDGDYVFNEIMGSAATVKSKDAKVALKDAQAISSQSDSKQEFILNPWKNASGDDTWAAYGTVYAHVAKIKTVIKESVGGYLTPWMDQPTEAYVNYNSNCNAFWNGKSINFFQGSSKCFNSGNMGEIVLHEWGHGLDFNLGGISDGAYSEGFGDLLAFSIYWSPKIGEGFLKTSPKAVRDISAFKSYPEDRGQVHAEGQIISNTMYELYIQLKDAIGENEAKKRFRKYLYNMIVSTKFYTDVHDFIQGFERDKDSKCLVNQIFSKHGLANIRPECNQS